MHVGYGETVFHERWVRDNRNAHGKLTPEYATPEPIDGVGVDVPQVREPLNGIDHRQVVDLVAFLPSGMTVDRRDRFTIRGKEYEVVGDAPAITNFFTGTPFLTETKLKRVTG